MTIEDAKKMLANCRDVDEQARRARLQTAQSMIDIRAAMELTEKRLEDASNVISMTEEIDRKFNSFKEKFDSLNKLAAERMIGMLGGGAAVSRRPAELISEGRVAQVLHRAKRVLVLTGAGISAESGIPTFRGSDGFWTVGSENYRPQELATWEKYNEMPQELWKWYQYRWGICTKAKPNPGHYALVELDGLIDGGIDIVTQNIDGLHRVAGSDPERLCEIHGRIDLMRCDEKVEGSCCYGMNFDNPDNFERARATLVKTPTPAAQEEKEPLPLCKKCGVRQRPAILWFDECYNEAFYKWSTIAHQVKQSDVLLIIGTMLSTGGPSRMVEMARKAGTTIIKMDTQVDLTESSSQGMLHVEGKSGEVLPRIVAELRALQAEPRLAPLQEVSAKAGSSLAKSLPGTPPGTPPKDAAQSGRAAAQRNSSTPATRRTNAGSITNSTFVAAGSSSLANRKNIRRPSPPRASNKLAANASNKLAANATARAAEISEAPVGFFVYGTLRPDDDTGASWTKGFNEGMNAEVAFLDGASLYVDGSYPALCLEQTRCCVRGVLLTPPLGKSSALVSKLKEADTIEGYPDLYDRKIVHCRTATGDVRPAYVYHRTGRIDRSACKCLLDGDWMSRKRD
jgi:NAD-dependent deacetylase